MADEIITLRGLNRAALARQHLLSRQRRPLLETIEALASLQAQLPAAPFVALWTRLEGFRRDELLTLIRDRQVVRATMMRATLHLTTAADYWFLRPALQAGLVAEYNSLARRRALGDEVAAAVDDGRRFFAEPHTFDEFRRLLEEHHLGVDLQALAYGVRTHLPLVQEPSGRATWGYPANPRFVTAEAWLGQPIPDTAPPRDLILRYLAAFGPARAVDVRAWAGVPPLRDVFEELRPELIELRDERGNVLVDLPDAPRPPGDTPAPPRFLPEFDNLLLAWKDRSRVIAEEHRQRIAAAPLMRPTILVDGFVAGTWKLERDGATARVRVEPFAALAARAGEALATEGQRLAEFLAPDADRHDAAIEEP